MTRMMDMGGPIEMIDSRFTWISSSSLSSKGNLITQLCGDLALAFFLGAYAR